MRMLIKISPRILVLFAFVSMCFVMPSKGFAAPTEQELKTIMNLSGKQRMLSQKMAKEALLVVKGLDADANRQNLQATTDLFKKTLTGLKDGDSTLGLPVHEYSRIKRELDKLQEIYNEVDSIYASIISGTVPAADQLNLMDQKSLAVLTQANKIVELFELEAKAITGVGNQELSAQINVAGRQRMLSQKMTKELLLSQVGVNAEANKGAMNDTIALFENSLKSLREGNKEMGFATGIQDPAILSQLDVVEKTWGDFKVLMQNAEATPETLEKIKDMNMSLMQEADKVVQSLSVLEVKG